MKSIKMQSIPRSMGDCLLFVRKQNKTQLKNLILKNNEKDFRFHQERLGVDSHCFYLPPMGEISPSVLEAVGWLFGFAALAKFCDTVSTAVKAGYDAKVEHGDTKIEINNH